MNGPRPLLFLDVDGPLIPFGGAAAPVSPDDEGNPLLARVDPAHGPRLAALPCELVWATTWMDDANACVAPRLGLGPLPVVSWPGAEGGGEGVQEGVGGVHWKTRGLCAWAAGRPFAWVDDEITDADRAWVADHYAAPALAHRVDPRRGLTDADFVALDAWLRAR
ncbi:HAD domain-containing protein [Streptomyces sp. G45]|uniref:HAD domain-containing protein n=1 Tax=Streptomyces sp. G45 TaxID=3406627 RepID=UPI003C21FF59